MPDFSVAFDLCALLLSLFCAIYSYVKRGTRKAQNRIFFLMMLNCVFGALFGAAGTLIEIVPELDSESFVLAEYILHEAYFIVHTFLPMLFALYILHVTGISSNMPRIKWVIFYLPLVATELLVLSNPVTRFIFELDAAGSFIRGPLQIIMYVSAAVYMIAALYILIRYRTAIHPKALLMTYICYFIAVSGVILQVLMQYVQIELFMEALGFLGLMLTFEEDANKYEPVTGLYNKLVFQMDNTRLLNSGQSYYIINIKLTNIRTYARLMEVDNYNRLMILIAEWVSKLRRNASAYHFDNNFALIATGIEEIAIRDIAEDITRRFGLPWIFQDLQIQLKGIVTIAKIPTDLSSLESIADMVEYEEEHITNNVTLYYRENLRMIQREAAIEKALKKAIAERSFQVYYQPIFNFDTGTITCAEALVRLFDDELGQISPGEFIPVAEKSSLIAAIGMIVFEKVCRFMSEQKIERYGIHYIEVNLSVAQFMYNNLVTQISNTISKWNIPAERLNLEITESVATDSSATFIMAIRELEKMGFTFSMDDYGTGYSNISSLLNVNFKNIKMDKSFLDKALEDDASRVILKDTAGLIRHLGLNVLQEGVETKEELLLVRSAGCNLVQGYFFSKPLPEADFLQYLRDFRQHIHAV